MPKANLLSVVCEDISLKSNKKYVYIKTIILKDNGKEIELSRYFPTPVALDLLEEYGLYKKEE